MAKGDAPKYPILHKYEQIDCLACNKGKIMTKSGLKNCIGCRGTGKIEAK